jgi:Transglutaminase-like superfamily/Coenzyme PQQ synthesis protein D (PqqD)
LLFETENVRSRTIDGRTILLDIPAGDYVVFDRTATAMWDVLRTLPPAERIGALQARFDAPQDRLAADLESFEELCRGRGFLGSVAPEPVLREPLRRVPRGAWTLRAWWTLATTTAALQRRGFAAVYRAYARLPRHRGPAVDETALRHAESAFLRAENFFALKTAPKDCLPRSLALYRFLTSIGFDAEHCIGVMRYHFEAHAWVRCGERLVLDAPEFVARYTVLARL